jgi:hypothetical protein
MLIEFLSLQISEAANQNIENTAYNTGEYASSPSNEMTNEV